MYLSFARQSREHMTDNSTALCVAVRLSCFCAHVQVLHVAVLRQHYDTVQALIHFGYPLSCKNGRKWMPLDEAVSLRDRRMVKLLHGAEISQIKALHKAKRGALLKTMQDMEDVTFKVWYICVHVCIALLLMTQV